jgi:hypothetical protein
MDRGDRGNTKGFYVLDASNKEVTEKFIENTISPKYVKHDIMDLLPLTPDNIKELFKNNFVDISIESALSQKFPFSQFTDFVKDFGHRRLELSSYSKDLIRNQSEIEQDTDYSYNIFSILDEHIQKLNLPVSESTPLIEKFKEVYDSLKNTKHYD